MRRYLIVSLLIGLCFNLQAEDTIQGGPVSGVWTADNSPYHIMGDITVQSQALVIEPGVKIIFHGHFSLNTNYGDLSAAGKQDSMIIFTIADTTGFANGADSDGGWKGISLGYPMNHGDSSRLQYCIFEYVKAGTTVAVSNPKSIISNCIFRNNYKGKVGVSITQADIRIKNNFFINNIGDQLFYVWNSNPLICGNEIRGNNAETLFIANGRASPKISKNSIIENKINFILWAREPTSTPEFFQNKIVNNTSIGTTDYLIYLFEAEAYVYNNLFANNQGRLIYLYKGNNKFVNNTIANNDCQGRILHLMANSALFSGNIIHGNNGYIEYYPLDSIPDLRYNLIEGGLSVFVINPFLGDFTTNIDTIPYFNSPTISYDVNEDARFADFGLTISSPLINIGDPKLHHENFINTDLSGNKRFRYGAIDMGALEFQVKSIDYSGGTIDTDTCIFGDTINISGDIIIEDDKILTVAQGSKLIFHGHYKIEIRGTLTAEGAKSDSILFTVSDTTGFYLAELDSGAWGGIIISNSGSMDDNIPSSLKYCILEYGKRMIQVSGFKFSAEHCRFRLNSGNPDIVTGSVLHANSSFIDIKDCRFISNMHRSIYLRDSKVKISNSVFQNNISSPGGNYWDPTCIYFDFSSELLSINNVFSNNLNGYVVYGQNSDCVFYNNLFSNNSGRKVLQLLACEASICNSTIVNNHCNLGVDEGIIDISSTNLNMYNSILFGNTGWDPVKNISLGDEHTDPNLYNCLLEGGLNSIYTSTFEFTGEYIDCLDEDPIFINPTSDFGAGINASTGNWQLLDISPCINTGIADTTGLLLPDSDLEGNPRFQNGRIDIGAYEKGGNVATITQEPQGAILCSGGEHTLEVDFTGSDTVIVQWKKDGIEIPGSNNTSLQLNDISSNDIGNYVCLLTNSFGTVNSFPVFLNVKSPPNILLEPDVTWVSPYEEVEYQVFAEGTSPLAYQWQKNNRDIAGETLPEIQFIPSDSSFEGEYTCIVSNICGADTTTPGNLYIAPQLCMVSVNPATGNNMVIWEKKSKAPLVAYNIYKESAASGIYNFMETIPVEDLSVYEDTVAIPTVQAYLYKVTGVDTAGNETELDLCRHHKTIHLLVSTNPELNSTQLDWDQYYGFDHLTSYIYRSSSGQEFEQVHSMSSALHSWIDPDPLDGTGYYRVAVVKPESCVPTGNNKKATQETFSLSLSNVEDNEITTIESQQMKPFRIFPNPVSHVLNIHFSNPESTPYDLIIRDLSGRVIRMVSNITTSEIILDKGEMNAGVYTVELWGPEFYRGKVIVE